MEFTPFLTLLVLTGLCLLLATTRKYAILLAGLLMYFYPIQSFSVLALAGIGFYIHRKRQRRHHVLPRSDT